MTTNTPVTRGRALRVPFITAMLVASLAWTGLMTGCNTTQGVGRDIEAVGGAIEDAAD